MIPYDEQYNVAVIIPCYNEALSIAKVIGDFRTELPAARIFVYDNNSTDDTIAIARANGAIVRKASLQGKGNVVRRMFADIDADIYVLVDGDATYDASAVKAMISRLVEDNLDTVIGNRIAGQEAFPAGHRFGNWIFNVIVHYLFGTGLKDIFSGYRVMSNRFVKSFPAHSGGFETETEMSIHILEMRIPYAEMSFPYFSRMDGSQSKLRTYRDGTRILLTILSIFKHIRPLVFFNAVGLILLLVMLGFGIPVILEYLETGLVQRLPTAVLASALGILAMMSIASGFILSGVARTSLEARHMRYLMFPCPYERNKNIY